jgi:DNA-directed RNA polymerase specialized sigma24 family protein
MSEWIKQLAAGQPGAMGRFFRRRPEQVALAARLIRHRRVDPMLCDPEDAVQDAWMSLCEDIREGKLTRVQSLDELHRLLGAVIRCQVGQHRRRLAARKRGGAGARRYDEAGAPASGAGPSSRRIAVEDLDQLASRAAPPEATVLVREWVEWLLRLLDATQRAIAGSRMEGVTNEEIAGALGLTIRTIERKLATMRLVIGRRLGIDPRKRSRGE